MGVADRLDAAFADLALRRQRARSRLQTDEQKASFLESGLLRTGQYQVARAVARGVRRIAVRCPRKVGKSWLAMVLAVSGALRTPGANWIIIGLTRPSIQAIYWRALQSLGKEMELGCHFQHTALVMNFPNGSTVTLTGAENRAEIEKLRGPAYHGAIVDECKSFNAVVFQELVYDVLGPALAKDKGPLVLIGTPGEVLAGPFYNATATPAPMVGKRATNHHAYHRGQKVEGSPPGEWQLHTWTQEDNTAVPDLWSEALLEKENAGWGDDHPTWRREYLGEWVASDSVIVYRYRPDRHDYDPDGPGPWGLPHDGPWSLVMGMDLGSKDGTAIVVWAYSPKDPALWEVYSEKRLNQNARMLAAWVDEVDRTLGQCPEVRIVDQAGLATMFTDTVADDYGLVLEPAEKREKLDHIRVFNTDLDAVPPRIRYRRDGRLGEETLGNRWKEDSLGTEKPVEDRRTPNDLCDAALYAFRYCEHRRYRPEKAPVTDQLAIVQAWRRQQLEDTRKRLGEEREGHLGSRAPRETDWWG